MQFCVGEIPRGSSKHTFAEVSAPSKLDGSTAQALPLNLHLAQDIVESTNLLQGRTMQPALDRVC